jgi:hypothetical protein
VSEGFDLSEDGLTKLIVKLADCSEEGARYAAQKIVMLVEDKIDIVRQEAEERVWEMASAADSD